jgi:hypothetical protein
MKRTFRLILQAVLFSLGYVFFILLDILLMPFLIIKILMPGSKDAVSGFVLRRKGKRNTQSDPPENPGLKP